jgi:tRNA 2-thiouridine synthesizing protein A
LERDAQDLWSDLLAHIRRRDCYLRAWDEAQRIDAVSDSGAGAARPARRAESGPATDGEAHQISAEWDAGGMGCGELVMALRLRMQKLRAGEIIRVTATDPAAPEDLPAWCRLCGHALVAMSPPNYWVRRKGD